MENQTNNTKPGGSSPAHGSPSSDTPETNAIIEAIASDEYDATRRLHVMTGLACKLERERNQLRDAIRKAATEYESVKWGWDGDCGTDAIMQRLEAHLPQNV